MEKKKKKPKRKAERRLNYVRSQPKLLILDLNGVLIRRNAFPDTRYTLRPHCSEFLTHFSSLYRLAIWTSISKKHGTKIVSELFPDASYVSQPGAGGRDVVKIEEAAASEVAAAKAGAGPSRQPGSNRVELLFAYYQDQCSISQEGGDEEDDDDDLGEEANAKPSFLKPLTRVWSRFPLYSSANTLLVDDTPAKTATNSLANVINPAPFDESCDAEADEELKPGGRLWRLLEARAVHDCVDVDVAVGDDDNDAKGGAEGEGGDGGGAKRKMRKG